MLTRWMLALVLSMAMLPALAQDTPPPGAVWNYGVDPMFASPLGQMCLESQFPYNADTNFAGFATIEGEFTTFVGNPPVAWFIPTPANSLAAKLIECYVPSALNPSYCPTASFLGAYPSSRYMYIEVAICALPGQQPWNFTLPLKRVAFFPPPIMGTGFEP